MSIYRGTTQIAGNTAGKRNTLVINNISISASNFIFDADTQSYSYEFNHSAITSNTIASASYNKESYLESSRISLGYYCEDGKLICLCKELPTTTIIITHLMLINILEDYKTTMRDSPIEEISYPSFEDYTLTDEPTDFLEEKNKIKSKNSIFKIFEGIKGTTVILFSLYKKILEDKINTSDIVDNLVSTSTNKPLSANQGKVLKDSITQLNNDMSVQNSAMRHNAIWRGKDITSMYNDGTYSKNVADGSFEDIFIGDYIIKSITVDGKTYTGKWVIAELDTWFDKGDTACTTHHALVLPDYDIGSYKMNDTNTTVGGFVGSDMYKTTLPKYLAAIQSSFGSSHILKYRSILTNSINATGYNKFGTNSGCSNGCGTYDSYIELLSEIMLYGSSVFSSSGYDIGITQSQLSIFRLNKKLINFGRKGFWLKDVATNDTFCFVHSIGYAGCYGASCPGNVRPFFLLI